MKRFLLLFVLAALAVSTLAGCGSEKKETKGGVGVIRAIDGGFVGTDTCLGCHDGSVATDRRSFLQTGHPYKYTHTGGADMRGTNTIPALWTRPAASTSDIRTGTSNGLMVADSQGLLDWSAIDYVVGGFGWKIRWGVKDPSSGPTTSTGHVWSGPRAQFNLWGTSDTAGALEKWSRYQNDNVDKLYECAICHNTNGIVSTEGYFCFTDAGTNAAPARTQPWANNPGMGPERHGGFESSWTFDGVQCEACHGPGVNHATTNGKLGVLVLPGGIEICAKCHIRAENNNDTFPATGLRSAECGGDASTKILTFGATANAATGFLGHHEQYNEMVGFQGDGVHAGLKCTTCHDPHKRSIRIKTEVKGFLETKLGVTIANPDRAEDGAIRVGCVSAGCHGAKPVKALFQGKHVDITCVDCHMAEATKSAINSSTAGWGRKGDIKTHIFKINALASSPSITRTNVDGKVIATNYLTVRYACGKCHDANIGAAPPLISGLTATATEAEKEAAFQAAATGYHTP